MNLLTFIIRKEFGASILLNTPMKQSVKELVNVLINWHITIVFISPQYN